MADLTRAIRTGVVWGGAGIGRDLVVEPGPDGVPTIDDEPMDATLTRLDGVRAQLQVRINGAMESHDVLVLRGEVEPSRRALGVERIEVVLDGWRFELDVELESRARLRERATAAPGKERRGGPVELHAIIPGRVVTVDVAEGDVVEAGQRVVVVEAMKMQNEIRAPRAGRIGRVSAVAGQTVELGDVLLVVE